MPILGGTPQKLLEGIDAAVSFSPDGQRLVFIRGNFPNQGESSLLIANADGSAERLLATKKAPERFTPIFFTGPSWSPDNKLVAAAITNTESRSLSAGTGSRVGAFHLEDGKEEILTPKPWAFVGRVQWLPDMSGLIVVGGDNPSVSQIWFLSYPSGEMRRITNDLNYYRSIGLTTTADKLVTIESGGLVNVWIAPEGDAKRAVQLPTGNVGFYASTGNALAWTPDGRVVFVSNESGRADIWIMDPDGSNRKQLTANMEQNLSPEVSPDGRYVVFVSTRGDLRRVWRINLDGRSAQPLTNGPIDSYPIVSADGKWVFYSSQRRDRWTLWRVSIDGGNATQLSDKPASGPAVSPDGKFVAYLFPDSVDAFAPPNRIGVMPVEGGEPSKTFVIQGSGTVTTILKWSADGGSLLYTVNNTNVTNIWMQNLDGSPAKQVTDFKDSLMTGFSYSRDGKQLACLRGALLRDAVLISDTK
jgi:TolB protein